MNENENINNFHSGWWLLYALTDWQTVEAERVGREFSHNAVFVK